MTVRLSRRASRQIEKIHAYVKEQRPSAASAFLDAFYELRQRLDVYPRSSPVIRSPDIHQATVAGFPYVVIYRAIADDVIIMSVVHTSRDPAVRTRP